jgi:hypothetical protein
MAKSRDMQQALDIVAGRKPAPAAGSKWSKLERVGVLLWVGVGIMIVGLAALYALS